MPYSNRSKLTTAPALVNGVIDTINAKRNDSIMSLQGNMETTSQWLDDAITSAKRKIIEGTGVSIQEVQKKAKTTTFDKSADQKIQLLSPIRDKENSVKPPPSAVKRKVSAMRVVDLRKELKSKGQETKGLKKDLQQRLLETYTTAENIMSPSKATTSPNNKPSSAESSVEKEELKDETAPEVAVDDTESHPNSESVEEIVFESSPSATTDKEVEPKESESKEDEPKSTTEAPEEFNNNETEAAAAKPSPDVEMTTSSKDVKSSRKSSVDAMDIEPTKEISITASADSDAKESAAVSGKEKRVSLMDCDEAVDDKSSPHSSSSPKDDPPAQNAGVPKVTMTLEVPVPTNKTPSMKSQKDNSLSKEPESSRKVSQASISKAGGSAKMPAASKSSFLSNNSSKSTKEGSSIDAMSTTKQSQKQSPIKKRVQAAIQMFTAGMSPVKPKPTSTPSKLSWLTKNQATKAQPQVQKQQGLTANDSALQQIQGEAPDVKKQLQPKAEKLAAARRPGMGLSSTHNASSSSSNSALKSSRLMAGKPSSALSSSAQAKNEARKARLAEIRGKSKPVSNPTSYAAKTLSATKDLTASALKAKTAATDDSKRKLLTAQMREKAAARKQMEAAAKETKTVPLAAASTVALTKYTAAAQASSKQESAVVASSSSVAGQNQQLSNKSPEQAPVAPAKAASTPDALAALRPQLLSPMDTYEISDREDSDTGSESDSDSESSRKKIPDWAQRAYLIPALEKQFAQGIGRCDPDEIFPEVQTCDLQAIFNSKRSRYIRRTSSGNWGKDKVTAVEKLTYKRTMGYSGKRKK